MIKLFGTGLFILVFLVTLIPVVGGCGQARDLPNIILISIDTLRADHCSCYGYDKKTTPMLDLLAEKGVRFSHSYSSSPWTLPSHASMFSGLYPFKHHAVDDFISIHKSVPMLAEKLKAAGYETGAFVSHYYLSKDYGFDRGFDKFVTRLDAPATDMSEIASRWIRDHRKGNFFAFIHYFDPHTPYRPPLKYARKHYPPDMAPIAADVKDTLRVIHSKNPDERSKLLEGLLALYDAEIDFTDSAIGELFKKLQLFKLDQNTLIVVTSDHGEEFFEHGLMEHGFTLYDEQIRVPLIFYCPDRLAAGRVVDTPASNVDIMPTLMDYAGLRPPTEIDGSSLLPLVLPESRVPIPLVQRALHAQTTRQGPDRMCVVKDKMKYIYSPTFRLSNRLIKTELFNLAKDPNEQDDLIDREPERAGQYHKVMTDTGMYLSRKVWHIQFAGTKGDIRYNGQITTISRIVASYKDNVIYDTDAEHKLVSNEFPWKKRDSMIQFVAFGKDGSNGFSFVTDPPNAKVNVFLYVDGKTDPAKITLGAAGVHPDKIPFTLEENLPRKMADLPPGGYLVWSTDELVNSKSETKYEIGDAIAISPEMRDRLRTLGYLTGSPDGSKGP